MFSRLMRIGVVLLALAQLGLWGIYAPAHRLLHHSHLLTVPPEPGPACHSHCCSHHSHHEKSASCSDQSDRPAPEQCPEDDHHCGFCAVALQVASAADPVRLTNAIEHVEPSVEQVEIVARRCSLRVFDGRGPPVI